VIEFTIETEIERPPAEVFAYATDPAKLSSWQTNTVSAVQEGDGPLGVGTRLREVHRALGGRELASLVEVSGYEPGRLFALRILEGPLPVHARLEFEPTAVGTELRFTAHGELSGPMRLLTPLMRRALKRQFAADCERLKQLLEAAPGPGAGDRRGGS
jgi:uncharacterized protein YndB with AHSA1/START domain